MRFDDGHALVDALEAQSRRALALYVGAFTVSFCAALPGADVNTRLLLDGTWRLKVILTTGGRVTEKVLIFSPIEITSLIADVEEAGRSQGKIAAYAVQLEAK